MPFSPAQTQKRKDRFLKLFAEKGNVTDTARALKLDRTIIYKWRHQDQKFKAQFDEAEDLALDHLEDLERRHGLEDSATRKWLLTKRRNAKYGDKQDLNFTGPMPFTLVLGDKTGGEHGTPQAPISGATSLP